MGSILPEALTSANLNSSEETIRDWLEIAAIAISRLLESGRWQSRDGEGLYGHCERWRQLKNTAKSSHAILATLPLALFFHELPNLLAEKLQQAAVIWQDSEESIEDVAIWGYALSLALGEKLRPDRFIEQILEVFRGADTPLARQLEEIDSHLKRGSGLEEVVDRISGSSDSGRGAIALALYCFSSTPEDYCLSVGRAFRSNFQPRTTAALTGALAGAYNSVIGIPADWRLLARKHPLATEMERKAKLLFALWSGVYRPELSNLDGSVAVASVRVIQPRSSLKIISQTEL